MCSSANVSFFHIKYQYSLSTQQGTVSAWGRNNWMRGGEKEDQTARGYWHALFLTKQQQRMKNLLLPPPSSRAITTGQFSAVFSRASCLLCSIQMGKLSLNTVRHLSQSSGILATAIQLSSTDTRKACLALHNALFKELRFPWVVKIPCRNFAQLNNSSVSSYFSGFWCGSSIPRPCFVNAASGSLWGFLLLKYHTNQSHLITPDKPPFPHYLYHLSNSQNESCAKMWKMHERQDKLGQK